MTSFYLHTSTFSELGAPPDTSSSHGLSPIKDLKRLGTKHSEHIAEYGEGNERRLTGKYETADIGTFSFGVANRGCSIRIPRTTEADGFGYLEDRRPSSNCDPYIVTSKIMDTCTDPNGKEADIKASNVQQIA